jgi:BASS family bile acid:Na+ symporter
MSHFYLVNEYWFATTQLVLAMLGMGATLTPRDFKDVIYEPKAVTLGVTIQLFLIPLIAYAFIQYFGLQGGVAIGVALIAVIPGGTSSNVFTFFAKGNIALSISITGLTTIACLLTTPLFLGVVAGDHMPKGFVMPTTMIMTEIALTLLLPLFVGMLVLRCFPKYAAVVASTGIKGTLIILLMIVVGSASAGRLDINAFGWHNVGLIVLLMVSFGLVGWLVTFLFNLSRTDAVAIEVELVVRNINLGVLIKASLFPAIISQTGDVQLEPVGDFVLFALLLFGGVQMLAAGLMIAVNRRMHKRIIS